MSRTLNEIRNLTEDGEDQVAIEKARVKVLEMEVITDVNKVNVTRLEDMFNMPKGTLRRPYGHVDILIGVDHAHLMTGKLTEVDGLVALETPLGCAVYGGKTSEQITNVMHIKINKPVNLERFWTWTEDQSNICISASLPKQNTLLYVAGYICK